MPVNRMNREEFFGKLTGLDEERLKRALWNLYWRTEKEKARRENRVPQPKRTLRARELESPLADLK